MTDPSTDTQLGKLPDQPPDQLLGLARDFATSLLGDAIADSGEPILAHAAQVASIVASIDASPQVQAAAYLVYTCDHLNKAQEVLAKRFDPILARLVLETRALIDLQAHSRGKKKADAVTSAATQIENVRKMLLAFGRDLRVVLLRLASRLQSLRYCTKQRVVDQHAEQREWVMAMARETLEVFAPLANRLGMGQIKWELEDLAFRLLEPETYKTIANRLDEKRVERLDKLESLRGSLSQALSHMGLQAQVEARPKHIYSIVKKMRGKNLPFERVFDVRAMRVVVATVADCYSALALIHERFAPIAEEFDDYIAKPKSNGYQSLHTVVLEREGESRQPIEIQIRTQAMHTHAEQGVAAHWVYKEAGSKGYAGVQASGEYEQKIAALRALLAWEREVGGRIEGATTPANGAQSTRDGQQKGDGNPIDTALLQDRIYVFTPDAAIIDLPQGATPVDFAYALHTQLGHRCRGAQVDGALVPLNTPLQSGQTVSIHAVKEGGPSRDWLNLELGFMVSSRGRAKVRAWFNAQVQEQTIAKGREQVEKTLQRLGKTAVKLDDLSVQLGFKKPDYLFEAVGKDEFSRHAIEQHFEPAPTLVPIDELLLQKQRQKHALKATRQLKTDAAGVLVEGVAFLLTQLAKCCKPAPPDAIGGYVTRGKGVGIHRSDCPNFLEIASRNPDRVIDVSWQGAKTKTGQSEHYPVDVAIAASDRAGLLRDISEVFAKEKMNVIGVQTQSVRDNAGVTAWMTFTVEVQDTRNLRAVFATLAKVAGVRSVRRK